MTVSPPIRNERSTTRSSDFFWTIVLSPGGSRPFHNASLPPLTFRDRWEGTVPEPRPGIPSGHIPNSLPMPFPSYLNPASDAEPYTSYKPVPELKEILIKGVGGQEVWKRLNSDRSAGLIFSCGSGMTAAVGWVASEMVKDAEGSNMSSTLYDEVSVKPSRGGGGGDGGGRGLADESGRAGRVTR